MVARKRTESPKISSHGSIKAPVAVILVLIANQRKYRANRAAFVATIFDAAVMAGVVESGRWLAFDIVLGNVLDLFHEAASSVAGKLAGRGVRLACLFPF